MSEPNKLITVVLGAAFLGCVGPAPVSEQQWFLMARHGECMAVEGLKRRIPDLADIRDPYSFIKFMRQNGHAVASTEMTEVKGKAVEVKVPEKGLSLIFVTAEICQGPPIGSPNPSTESAK